ncbi:MAG: protein BatD [Fuerstiella sp.]|nr:protein BatD [Fuerstiella sp.]MCP4787399.1 protein BatD [Fuerstiella sp.]MCP4856615.1 protein BatD [Fuerstiella sp.]
MQITVRTFITNSLVLLQFAAAYSTCAAQEPEIIVEVDRQQLYEGESITYRITLNHVENPTPPKLNGFDSFRVESLGEQALNSRQITIINGRRSEITRRGRQYDYRLTPISSGQFSIPAPSAVVNGQTLTGREILLKVIAAVDQDIVLLEMKASRASVYPMQPFTISLNIAIRQLPDPLSDRSPLSVQPNDPVKLSVPWLDDNQVPKDLAPAIPWQEVMNPLISRSKGNRGSSDGMQVNNIGSQSAFSIFSRGTMVFLPPSVRTTRTNADGDQVQYVEYTLQREFVPQTTGVFSFGPVTMKGMFGTELADGRLDGDQIYAVAKAATVVARDAPLESRPTSFSGGIGVFDVTASLTPVSASVGDPMTLSLRVHGEGTLADIRPPDISSIPEVSQYFKTYDATEATHGNVREFTYSLRPLTTDSQEFPAIPVSYFDVDSEDYVTVRTVAIPITIEAARQLAVSDIVSQQVNNSNGRLEVSDAGIFANHTSLQTLRASEVSIGRWLALWSGMLAAYGVAAIGIIRYQQVHSDPLEKRRRTAKSRAAESLKRAQQYRDSAKKECLDAMNVAVTGLIADFSRVSEAGMTSHDAAMRLQAVGADTSLQDRTTGFLDRCDAARYGATEKGTSELLDECRLLVGDLGRELEKRC